MSENTVQSREPAKPGMQASGGNGGIPQFLVDLARNAPAMMWVFTGTTFLSALLLFAIQPMFAKMVLPVLGGSPSVWSVSVFFFQGALLAGYIYAHFLIKKAPAHLTGIIHLAVCVVAFAFLVLHAITWFHLTPAAMVVRLRGRRVGPAVIAGSAYAGWVVVSALVAWIVLRQ